MKVRNEIADQSPERVETAKSRALKSLNEMLKPLYDEMEANRKRNEVLAKSGMQTSSESESSSR